MNEHLVFGLFAFYVVIVSLYGILSGKSDARLAFVRKAWGRMRGLSLYFCVHVVLPLLVGIVFFGWGVVNFQATSTWPQSSLFDSLPEIDWQTIHRINDPAEPVIPSDFVIPLCA